MEIAEDMTLEEHDRHYHEGNYRGGRCLFRERLDQGDAALNDANEKEGVISFGRKFESRQMESAVRKNFRGFSANSSRIQLLEPDQDGNNRLMVWCNVNTDDSALDEGKLSEVVKKMGYELTGFSILEEKATGVGKHLAKPKKLFAVDMKRVGGSGDVKFVDPGVKGRDMPVVQQSEGRTELDDEKRSELLRRYGVKSEGGVIKRRTEEDAKRDRIRKYLGILNDFGKSGI